MKTMTAFLLASVFTAASNATFAADLPSRRVSPSPSPAPVTSWAGFYAGAQAGYEVAQISYSVSTINGTSSLLPRPNGIVGGLHVGYNFEVPSFYTSEFATKTVFGLEGELNGSDYRARAFSPIALANVRSDAELQGSVRGRLGISFDQLLLYVTGGVAIGQFVDGVTTVVPPITQYVSKQTKVGYTVGAGGEYAFTDHVSARIEYRFTDYGRVSDGVGTNALTHREEPNLIIGGFSYRFATTPAPVVARY